MNTRQHALLARQLIAACGGLDEAAAACRLNRSRLSEFQTPEANAFMPADVMADLEAYAGEPIYSRALCEARPAAPAPADLLTEACEAAETAVDLQRTIRLAVGAAHGLSPRQRDAVEGLLQQLDEDIRQIRATNSEAPLRWPPKRGGAA